MRRLTLYLTILLLTACAAPEPTLVPFPTLVPTDIPPTVPPIATAALIEVDTSAISEVVEEDAPTPTTEPVAANDGANITVEQVAALPLPDGRTIACRDNSAQLQLVLPDGTPVLVISRIHAHGERILMLIDGGLYGLERSLVDSAPSTPLTVIPLVKPGDFIGGRPVQELSDLAYDPDNGVAYLLDKVGHVFWHEVATGQSTLVYRALSNSNQGNDPQIAAIELDETGLLLLDTANGVVWRTAQLETLRTYSASFDLQTGVDLAFVGEQLYAINQRGKLMRVLANNGGTRTIEGSEARDLALSIKSVDDTTLQIVDALKREVVLVSLNGVTEVDRFQFAIPELGLVRDATFEADRLYAITDGSLLVFPVANADCRPPSSNFAYVQPFLYGNNIIAQLNSFVFPVLGDELPPWPRMYPGARRLYRMGIHRGIDLYGYGVNTVFGIGHPVEAIAAGEILRATEDYQRMAQDEWLALAEQSKVGGFTTDQALVRFSGRQVVIDHSGGVRSVYSHLDLINEDIRAGESVERGQRIGAVGVTGTLGESLPGAAGPHLHFEIWINDRYLGYGLTVRETMWWIRTGLEGGE